MEGHLPSTHEALDLVPSTIKEREEEEEEKMGGRKEERKRGTDEMFNESFRTDGKLDAFGRFLSACCVALHLIPPCRTSRRKFTPGMVPPFKIWKHGLER